MNFTYAVSMFYVIILIFSWLHMRRIAAEACEYIGDLILREVRLRNVRGGVEEYDHLLSVARVFVGAHHDEVSRQLMPHMFWMCFTISASLFADSEGFEKEFRKEFGINSILSAIEYLDTVGHSHLEEFQDVLRAVVVKLESSNGGY